MRRAGSSHDDARMSGIAGIVNLDDAPVDPELLSRLTESLAFRGPDGKGTWVEGNVGLGQTLLKTTDEAEGERQPFTLDSKVWIVADARVDAQRDLIAELGARGQAVVAGACDVELILRSYLAWGEDCVDHLLGDFSFGIWDGPRRRLFCARDHLGVRPFFFSRVGQCVVFSNTLDTVLLHPAVPDRLNDLFIADFLLFGHSQETDTTVYAAISRLPPAHTAVFSPAGSAIKRYWTLPIDEPVYFRRGSDYIDRFKELLFTAVEDRLRTNRFAILMSGGVDSPSLAAVATSILSKRGGDFEFRAFHDAFEGYEEETGCAELVASHLNIPIQVRWRTYKNSVDPDWRQTHYHTPEPAESPLNLRENFDWFKEIGAHSRVLLYGEGPDNALTYEWRSYSRYLIERGRYGRLLTDICGHMWRHRRIPMLGTIPRMIRERLNPWPVDSFPPWLNADLVTRCALRSRWEAKQARVSGIQHPLRPVGYRSFTGPLWPLVFEDYDAQNTQAPLETRHPYVDLRVLRFMLSVPAVPWCRIKYLLRQAMQGMLPDQILWRGKAVFRFEPPDDLTENLGFAAFVPGRLASSYLAPDWVPEIVAPKRLRVEVRPHALNYWLENIAEKSKKPYRRAVDQ